MRKVFTLVAFAAVAAPAAAQVAIHSADSAVYRAVLDSMFIPHSVNSITRLVIRDSTSSFQPENPGPDAFTDLYRLPEVDSAAVRDFARRNRQPQSLRYLSTLGLRVPVVLINADSLRGLNRTNPDKFWSGFYSRYPGAGGTISLHSIGYGAKGTIAVLIVDQGCGSLCGGGYNIVVKRERGRWRVLAIQQTWVS
jgi:hypothetical protein